MEIVCSRWSAALELLFSYANSTLLIRLLFLIFLYLSLFFNSCLLPDFHGIAYIVKLFRIRWQNWFFRTACCVGWTCNVFWNSFFGKQFGKKYHSVENFD